MDSLNELLNLAKSGHFQTGNGGIIATPPRRQRQAPTKPVAAVSLETLPTPLPEPITAPKTRLWLIQRQGKRFIVEFSEPQTATPLQEQAARNTPNELDSLHPLEPFIPSAEPLPCNGTLPVDNSENPNRNNPLQQQNLLSDNAVIEEPKRTAAELLNAAGVTVRYLQEPEDAARVIGELLALADNGLAWGLDIETMPLPAFRNDRKAGLDPWRSAIRLVQIYPGAGICYVFDIAGLGLSPLRELLHTRSWVAHNAVFELKHLLHGGIHPTRLGCTLLQDNALGHRRRSLAALAAARLGWHMDKALQVSDWTAAKLEPAQRDYAALDAVAAYRLAGIQREQLQTRNLGRCYALMRDAQHTIAQMELAGCPFDVAAHTVLVAQWQTQAEQARYELDSLLSGVNPDSPAQLAAWLEKNLPPDTLGRWERTPSGQLKTDADTLTGLSLPALEPLARYKAAMKGLSTYGKGYAAHMSPVTGRIHASFLLGGAESGRLSCQSPNIQNPPRDTAFRALFAPTPGRCLVVADYGQIELRVAALVAGDENMLAAYEQGQDLHRKTAAAVLGIEPEQVTKAQRQMAKAVNFGLLFGQGAKGLQAYAKASYGVELSQREAEQARTAFFTAYPSLRRWQQQQQEQARFAQQVRTPGGRVRGLDGARQLATASLNTPIQGGAAECLLAALAALSLPDGAALVNVVHDELVVECTQEQAEPVKVEVERAMVAGFLAIFPEGSTRDLVEAQSGANWAAAKG